MTNHNQSVDDASGLHADRLAALRHLAPELFGSDDGTVDADALLAYFNVGGDVRTREAFNFTWVGKRDAIVAAGLPPTGTLVPEHSTAQHSTAQHSTAQHSTAQHSTAQHSTAQHSTAQHSTAQHSGDDVKSQNVIIEGDNLEVLRILRKSYAGKIKLIYIDPPYNTGNDFVYPDNYAEPVAEYLRRSGATDGDGRQMTANTRADGRFHAKWLTMMYPRLVLARELLRDDGVIFVSIDDNEVHHLRAIMNEIFGEENFVSMIVWNSSTAGGIRPKHVSQTHEYAIMFAKSKELLGELFAPLSEEATQQYSLRDDRGLYREKDFAWRNNSNNLNQRYGIQAPDGSMLFPGEGYIYRFVKTTFENALVNNMVVFKETNTSPLVDGNGNRARYNIYIKKYLGAGKGAPSSIPPRSIVGLSNRGAEDLKNLFDGLLVFNNPKSIEYLKYLIEIGTDESSNDIVLDFFAGSGSTAHAVMSQNISDDGNRKFILVQFPEPLDPANTNQKTTAEFCDSLGKPRTIVEITKERVRRAAAKIRSEHPMFAGDVGFEAFKLAPTHILPLATETHATVQSARLAMFADRLVPGWHVDGLASELLLREGFPLTATWQMIVPGWRFYTAPDIAFPLLINLEERVADIAPLVAQLVARGWIGVNKRHGVAICRDDAIESTQRMMLAEYVTVKTL